MALHQTWVALIRGIGAASHKKMSMAALRDACTDAGLAGAQTVLATGNVIFQSNLGPQHLQTKLDQIIAGFDLSNEVFLRRPAQMIALHDANPFQDAAAERPNHLLIHVTGHAIAPDALLGYDGPERLAASDRAVFIDFKEGIGASNLTPARLQRLLGGSGTARNWNTWGRLIAKAG